VPSRQQRRTVFCIGDDPLALNLRCTRLRAKDFAVVSSGNRYEALIQFGESDVDAVILDLDGGGPESAVIAGEVKKLRPQVPVVVLVTKGDGRAQMSNTLADAVVVKSEEKTRLLRALAGVLRTS